MVELPMSVKADEPTISIDAQTGLSDLYEYENKRILSQYLTLKWKIGTLILLVTMRCWFIIFVPKTLPVAPKMRSK